MQGKCDICGESFKNLGSHMVHAHGEKSASVTVDANIVKEQPLQNLVQDIKDILRPFQHDLTLKIDEKNGSVIGLELMARIQAKGTLYGRK